MSKFKAGDKVRFVDENSSNAIYFDAGLENLEIKSCVEGYGDCRVYESDKSAIWEVQEEELELMPVTLPKLVIGEYAIFNGEHKRIYLGTFNGNHLAVGEKSEENYKEEKSFDTCCWKSVEPLPKEPITEKRYRWLKDKDGFTDMSPYISDEYANDNVYLKTGWYKSKDFIEVEIKGDR